MTLGTQPATDRAAQATGPVALATVTAAWPTGVSALALAVNSYQRRDFQLDRMLRSAIKIAPTPSLFD